jgi:hypothetical protein
VNGEEKPDLADLTLAELVASVPAQLTPKKNTIGRHRGRRCACGTCTTCIENARWERIFREKFADPDYYTRPVRVIVGSSLK